MIRLAPLVLAALAMPALAQTAEVDLELALMVDVSRSMSDRELEIQRRGYAEALRSDAVWTAVETGALQKIAITYVEWAGIQKVIVDWREIASPADLAAFADLLEDELDPSLRRTSISGALDFARESIASNAFDGWRQVIDVSGDGPNNQGRPVTEARDRAVAEGITVNGLPLMTRDGMGGVWTLDRLDLYYQTCVTGGPGSFVIPVLDWEDFEAAVRRKLVQEIAALPARTGPDRLIPVQMAGPDPTDCLIGEKIRRQRNEFWDQP